MNLSLVPYPCPPYSPSRKPDSYSHPYSFSPAGYGQKTKKEHVTPSSSSPTTSPHQPHQPYSPSYSPSSLPAYSHYSPPPAPPTPPSSSSPAPHATPSSPPHPASSPPRCDPPTSLSSAALYSPFCTAHPSLSSLPPAACARGSWPGTSRVRWRRAHRAWCRARARDRLGR